MLSKFVRVLGDDLTDQFRVLGGGPHDSGVNFKVGPFAALFAWLHAACRGSARGQGLS